MVSHVPVETHELTGLRKTGRMTVTSSAWSKLRVRGKNIHPVGEVKSI
jgi:hypothetical protein